MQKAKGNKPIRRELERYQDNRDKSVEYAYQYHRQSIKNMAPETMGSPPKEVVSKYPKLVDRSNKNFAEGLKRGSDYLGKDTPIPQLSVVKREAKSAERQRMNTPGMGDVKSAERKESTSGSSKKPMPKVNPKPAAKPASNSKSAPAKKK